MILEPPIPVSCWGLQWGARPVQQSQEISGPGTDGYSGSMRPEELSVPYSSSLQVACGVLMAASNILEVKCPGPAKERKGVGGIGRKRSSQSW